MNEERQRLLTDADVEAIVSELKARIVADFQQEVGRGLLGLVWKSLFWLLLALAVFGLTTGKLPFPFPVEAKRTVA